MEIEYIIGTLYNDTLIGDSNNNQFNPLAGFNIVDGKGFYLKIRHGWFT